jgi:hypothetical protein
MTTSSARQVREHGARELRGVVRLDSLTPAEQELVLALIEAARARKETTATTQPDTMRVKVCFTSAHSEESRTSA